ncbi:ATP-binding cassette domain-containing protein [Loktanella sp. DJP18]|uniref:ATP-binding cassette domain-containing protein n=1 Tax=Loktanella sp. DJP18 TaxID=3409788 RepID=UPI003BB7AA41
MSILPLTLTAATVQRRGKRLLGPVDLTLGAGGVTVIVGPNGSGKTTLLRVMHGVERLTGGSARWAVPQRTAQARQAFVFQSPIMLRRSVAANLRYPLVLQGTARAEQDAAVAHWAGRIGLADALDTPAPRLSGGERQKLALGRALIGGPEVLFLDEPCASLDGAATLAIEGLLREARDAGVRVVMATHDIGQARRLADDALFVLAGRIAEAGPRAQMFDAPRTPALAAFLNGDIVT